MEIKERAEEFLQELLEAANNWSEKYCFWIKTKLFWDDEIGHFIVVSPNLSAETYGVSLGRKNIFCKLLRGVVVSIILVVRKMTNYKLQLKNKYETDEVVKVVLDDGTMLTLVPEITPNGILIRTKMVGRAGKTYDGLLEPKEAIRWLTNIIELYKEAIEDDGY
jgi:hypothetical protein